MREIKFRAWDIHGNDWFEINPTTPINILQSKNFKVMQYTGLKDKNGKEIYEGDIIKDSFGDRLGKIRYNTHSASFELYDYDGIHLLSSHNGENFFEVIGNIYEHPHLLEGET